MQPSQPPTSPFPLLTLKKLLRKLLQANGSLLRVSSIISPALRGKSSSIKARVIRLTSCDDPPAICGQPRIGAPPASCNLQPVTASPPTDLTDPPTHRPHRPTDPSLRQIRKTTYSPIRISASD